MNITTNYNVYKTYPNITMKGIRMNEKSTEKTAEYILRALCDFNAHDLNFGEFHKLVGSALKAKPEIKNCDTGLYKSVCENINKVVELDPLDVQLYRTDVNKFLSNLYEKGEYKELFVEKQFDVMYNKEQELKNFKPSWM